MRIFASRTYRDIDDFVGKDVWVKARVRFVGGYGYGYIRILSAEDQVEQKSYGTYTEKMYKFNFIDLEKLSYGGEYPCTEDEKQLVLKNVSTLSAYDIKFLRPLDCMATDDIFMITD